MAKKPARLDTSELAVVRTLRANGMSYRGIARELGCDHKTVARACQSLDMAPQIEQIKASLADLFEGVSMRMLTAISDKNIDGLDAYKKTLSAAIAADKFRLLSNQSTANVSISVIVEEIERKEAELRRRDRERQKEAQKGEE